MKMLKIVHECILISVILFVAFCQGQQGNSVTNISQDIIFPKIPKCCLSRTENWNKTSCFKLDHEPVYEHNYFRSNTTHIFNTSVHFNITDFYQQTLNCTQKYVFEKDDFLGFIYNSSIITSYDLQIISPSNYCVNSANGQISFILCHDGEVDRILKGQVYFPCLIVSTFCYFISAIIYHFILKVKDVYKKCFVGYCLSMGVTFLCLILLQEINSGCAILGSIFFLFILASFSLLCYLCLDTVFIIRNFMKEDSPERLYFYIGASILIPTVMLAISIIPSGIPDVPTSFLKERGMCNFKGEETRILILFIPMTILLLASLCFIIYSFCLIKANSKKFKSDINWLERKSQYKYMTYQNVVLFITMLIFLTLGLLLSIYAESATIESGMLFSLQILDSLQGLLILSVFVIHYIRRKKRDESTVHFNKERCLLRWSNDQFN